MENLTKVLAPIQASSGVGKHADRSAVLGSDDHDPDGRWQDDSENFR